MAATDDAQQKSTIREYYEALLIAVIFVRFLAVFVFQAFKIPSGSMEDNLKVGDHIIVNKFIFGAGTPLGGLLPLREIRRGDIIVFRYPQGPETDFVKRVIGMPGDTIEERDKVIYINGRKLDEPYVIHTDPQTYPDNRLLPDPWRSRDTFKPVTVPEGNYFAMGDNRDRSSDSRYWGFVPRSMIKGRAFLVYWSYHGKPPAPDAPLWPDRVKELAGVAGHFFTRTRWDRTFLIVDSKYHYHAETAVEGEEEFAP